MPRHQVRLETARLQTTSHSISPIHNADATQLDSLSLVGVWVGGEPLGLINVDCTRDAADALMQRVTQCQHGHFARQCRCELRGILYR